MRRLHAPSGPIPKIGDLAIYDIAHRIGAYFTSLETGNRYLFRA
jgi:hypothetical protein